MEEKVINVVIADDKRSGLATASLVLGIVAIIGSWIPFLNILSIMEAIVGLVLGIIALIILLTKKKGSMSKNIVGIVLCFFAMFIGISVNNEVADNINEATDEYNDTVDEMNGNKTDEILANEIEVSIGSYVTDGNVYYESGSLEVTIKNKTSETQTYTVSIEALDNDNIRIDTDDIYVTSLAAGQSGKYEVFTFGDVEDLKNVKSFKVYEVSKY